MVKSDSTYAGCMGSIPNADRKKRVVGFQLPDKIDISTEVPSTIAPNGQVKYHLQSVNVRQIVVNDNIRIDTLYTYSSKP